MEIERVNSDNISKTSMPYTFEKLYALPVESCLKFGNEFIFQEQKDGVSLAFVEISIANEIKKADLIIKNFQHPKTAGIDLLEVISLDPEQRVKKGGTFKFILKMQVTQAKLANARMAKNLGRVQFEWKTSKNDIDGGVLAYGLDSKETDPAEVIHIEAAEEVPLKVLTLTELKYKITNT